MDALLQGWEQALPGLRLDLLLRLVVATVLGGLVGWERESSGKPAGLRTNILICVGAALLTYLSPRLADLMPGGSGPADPARIAAQIVSGIGFLGAGTIIQSRGSVSGLTTAATLWVVAAIGMTVGSGHYVEAVGTTVLVLLVLVPLGLLEHHLARSRRGRPLRVEVDRGAGVVQELVDILTDEKLHVHTDAVDLDGDRLIAYFDLAGKEEAFLRARERLLERTDIRALHFG